MRRLAATLFIAAASACAPAQGPPTEPTTSRELTLYLTGSFEGAGLIPIDPLTLEDRSTKPLLPIGPTSGTSSSIAASLDGGTIAVMNYGYGSTPQARGLDIAVFDARTGALRSHFNPEVAVIVDGLSPDGTRIYARHWPPAEATAERLVLDARTGTILDREPRFTVVGDVVARTSDEYARHLYGLLVSSDPNATAPRPVDLVTWDLRSGKELWRVRLPALAAGEWKTGRIVDGAEVRSRLVPAVALSADRRRIAVVSAFGCCMPNGTMWLVDAETGTLISHRTFSRSTSILDRLFAPSVAMAKSLDESTVVHASFSTDGQVVHVYAQSSKIDDRGEPKTQYLGMAAVTSGDAVVRADDMKMEIYWYENLIEWTRESTDGRWLYVFLERIGNAEPKGHYLRRLDAATLRVVAERRFDAHRQSFLLGGQ